MAEVKDPFFVGWGKIPKDLKMFLTGLSVVVVAGFAVLAYVISSTQNDPGGGGFAGRASAVGVLQGDPYPVVYVIESDRYKQGEAIILNGAGKRGVMERAQAVDGQVVRIAGTALVRDALKGMQLRGGKNGLRGDDTEPGDFSVMMETLGRWRLTGEITGAKCLNGAMRPGMGLAHKACANLCMLGGVPPVFVSSAPVAGSQYLLMGDADGMAVTQEILDFTATNVEIEGEIERRGDLLIFKISPQTIKRVK